MDRRATLYLICYDIRHPRRLGRVARYLEKNAIRIQYSVFSAHLDARRLRLMLEELDSLIEPKEDDIRVYPLPRQGEVTLIGKQLFDTDTLLLSNGHNLLQLGSAADKIEEHKVKEPT